MIQPSRAVHHVDKFTNDLVADVTFGAGGRTSPFPPAFYGWDMVRQSDGRLVVKGMFATAGDPERAVARVTVNGSLDTTFGVSGVRRFGGSQSGNFVNALPSVSLATDGRVVLAHNAGVEGPELYSTVDRIIGNVARTSVTAVAAPATVVFGATTDLTFTVSNAGPDASGARTLTLTLPSGLELVSVTGATCPAGSCSAARR